jgi:hypothetical protein
VARQIEVLEVRASDVGATAMRAACLLMSTARAMRGCVARAC